MSLLKTMLSLATAGCLAGCANAGVSGNPNSGLAAEAAQCRISVRNGDRVRLCETEREVTVERLASERARTSLRVAATSIGPGQSFRKRLDIVSNYRGDRADRITISMTVQQFIAIFGHPRLNGHRLARFRPR